MRTLSQRLRRLGSTMKPIALIIGAELLIWTMILLAITGITYFY